MTYKITATAPTSYQTQSLRHFNIGCIAHGNGSFYGEKEFETRELAEQHLTNCAQQYNDADPCGSEDKIYSMLQDISRGYLRLDAVMANIEEVEEEETEE